MALATANSISEVHKGSGRIGQIPVRNLWLFMLYASDLFRDIEKKKGKVAIEDNPDDIPNLVAEILCCYVERRIQRNLSYGYQSREAVLSRVRGRIDLLSTERYRLLDRGKVACCFHELTINTARNRYVRTALDKLSKVAPLSKELAHRCRLLAARLRSLGVTGECPDRGEVSIDRPGRHDADDQPMIAAADLAFNLALPTEISGTRQLSLPDRENEGWIRNLYEKGVAGFYNVVLPKTGWCVHPGKTIHWQIKSMSSGVDKIFPSMRTDITLDNLSMGHRIVIDTKFTSVVTDGWYREKTLSSKNIYQIYAYLRSQEGNGDLDENASGLLLHPSVGDKVINEAVIVQNHEIRFATIDLMGTAKEIREQLLRVIKEPSPCE